ncbi:uncharacterized protein LOC141695601 [Apium graveolens]|uniref:uncharacterized protein LOC141695601 n=1 Tax=Apium graveolens TaxID=4045 RepID=UPI003D7AD5BB
MAQRWYSRLPPNSIGSFKDFSQDFIMQFISRIVHKKSSAFLMGIVQGANESLRDYLNRFTKEALKDPDLDQKLQYRAGNYIKVEESIKKTVVINEPAGNKNGTWIWSMMPRTSRPGNSDNRQLKDEIEYLIRRGKFGRFTKGEVAGGQKRDNNRRDDDQRGNDRDRNSQPRGQ